MDFINCIRRPFDVVAVEITLQNVHEVAKWCKGTVGESTVRMMGAETKLPCVELRGQGAKKNQTFTGQLGHYIVEHNGSFRVYRPQQFDETFTKKQNCLQERDLVEVVAEDSETLGWQGVATEVNQVVVDFGVRGCMRFSSNELKKIDTMDPAEIVKQEGPDVKILEDVVKENGFPTGGPFFMADTVYQDSGTKLVEHKVQEEARTPEQQQEYLQEAYLGRKLRQKDWVRVKNTGSDYYNRTGFVTVVDVEFNSINGVEVCFGSSDPDSDDGVKICFGYHEIELYSVV